MRYIGNILTSFLLAALLSPNFAKPKYPQTSIEINAKDQKKYAVFITGNNQERNLVDLEFGYNALLEQGFYKEDIYILDEDGFRKPYYYVYGKSTHDNVKTAFSDIASKASENDMLFVLITGDGRPKFIKYKDENGKKHVFDGSSLDLRGEDLTEIDLELYMKTINVKSMIMLADICFGSSFANRFGDKGFVSISPVESNTIAYGETKRTLGYFFFDANRTPKTDTNNDGRISVLEAYEYASKEYMQRLNKKLPSFKIRPMIKNPEKASRIFLK